jgi:uncharacterized membrane-anchored protein
MENRPSRWTKWWWLNFDLRTWTVEERDARIALFLTTAVIAVGLLWLLAAILAGIGVEEHVAATIAALFSVMGGFSSARTIVGFLFPKLLQIADQNAGKRGCPVKAPSKFIR